MPFDEVRYFGALGLEDGFGEPGYTPMERATARPTLEINGLWGGFQGGGFKTVLPKEAHAKISCRLVANQQPECVVARIARHIERHAPPGVRVEVVAGSAGARPYLIPTDRWANRIAAEVLSETYGREPYPLRMGASVPIAEIFLTMLGAYTITLGFAQVDENMHAPNEFTRLANFERGQQVWARALQRLGEQHPTRD